MQLGYKKSKENGSFDVILYKKICLYFSIFFFNFFFFLRTTRKNYVKNA